MKYHTCKVLRKVTSVLLVLEKQFEDKVTLPFKIWLSVLEGIFWTKEES